MTAEIVQFPTDGFLPIGTVAHRIVEGVIAELRMESGRVYLAEWGPRGQVTAWWPADNRRKRCIGLYDPIAVRLVR